MATFSFGGCPIFCPNRYLYDAALDVLGDWGSDRDWLPLLPPPPASPIARCDATKDSADERVPPKAIRSHYRRKRESRNAKRAALKRQIEQLARALEKQKTRFPVREQPLTGDALALSRGWSCISTRQRRQRHAGENEHKALQDAWATHDKARQDAWAKHAKVAHQIGRLLQKALPGWGALGETDM